MRSHLYWRIIFYVLICSPAICAAQQKKIDSLWHIITQKENNAETARALNKLSTEYSRSDIKRSKNLLYESISLSRSINRPDLLAYALAHMSALQSNSGHTDSAYHFLEPLTLLASKHNGKYDENVKGYYNYTAGLLLKQQGNYRAAIPYMLEGLKHFSKDGDPSAIAGQHMALGNNYIKLLDFKKALSHHLKSLELFIKAGNKRGESFSYQNIASDFVSMKLYLQALPYARKAMDLKKELEDKRGIAGAASGLGSVYEGLNQSELAIFYFDKSLQILKELNLPQEQAELQVIIGEHYSKIKDFVKARSAFERSLELAEQTKDSSLIHNAQAKIASTNKKGNLVDENKLQASLNSAIINGNRGLEIDIYKYLSDLYADRGDYKKALLYKDKYLVSGSQMQNNNLMVQLKAMEEQFRREKANKEIEILKKDRQIDQVYLQKQKNLKLSAIVIASLLLIILYVWIANQKNRNQLQMQKLRDDLSRDLHDDIGSRLTNIQFLTHLSNQSNINTQQKEEHMRGIKQEILASTQALDEIVWNMKTSAEELDGLAVRIRRYAGSVFDDETVKVSLHIQPDFPDDRIFHETQRDLFLMFKEILNNVRKHAQASAVDIRLGYTDKRLTLKVRDNGIGYDPARVKPKRNGLLNLKNRTEKWNGTFSIQKIQDSGTEVSLSIPYERISVKAMISRLKNRKNNLLDGLKFT